MQVTIGIYCQNLIFIETEMGLSLGTRTEFIKMYDLSPILGLQVNKLYMMFLYHGMRFITYLYNDHIVPAWEHGPVY